MTKERAVELIGEMRKEIERSGDESWDAKDRAYALYLAERALGFVDILGGRHHQIMIAKGWDK